MKFKNFDLNHDDIKKLVDLIIETEPSLFYLLFGRRGDKALSRIKNIVSAGKNSFGHDYIHLAIDKEKILGITTFYMANEIDKKVESEKFSKALDVLGLIRLNFYVKILINKLLTTKLEDKDLYIGNICVDKNSRGMGVGKFLLDNIIIYAKKKKCKKIILDVSKDNRVAINLYKKMGFEITKERSSFLWKISIYQMTYKI
jgi:ribosomal protein S18 acetylase RimI-like enzyme